MAKVTLELNVSKRLLLLEILNFAIDNGLVDEYSTVERELFAEIYETVVL